mmetsp:Transcript_44316/g.115171  ORF Transcript_44316/g.115171 Transcript_44316/m.115171 type:complete len:92 (+) Transcript_44316:326-601(+)
MYHHDSMARVCTSVVLLDSWILGDAKSADESQNISMKAANRAIQRGKIIHAIKQATSKDYFTSPLQLQQRAWPCLVMITEALLADGKVIAR